MEKLVINIEPKAQSRPRATIRGRHASVYEEPEMKRWRNNCKYLVKQTYKGRFFEKAVKTEITFFMKAPKSISEPPKPKARNKKIKQYEDFINEKIYVDKKPDLDNLEKAVYDSIGKSGVVWKDDNLLVEHLTRKIYSPRPRIEIIIKEI